MVLRKLHVVTSADEDEETLDLVLELLIAWWCQTKLLFSNGMESLCKERVLSKIGNSCA